MKSNAEIAVKSIYLSLVANALLAILKGLVGFFGNSYALIADAIESTSDVFSSLLALIGMKVATKPADDNHPYGHGKAEPIATFVVVVFLVVSAVIIAYKSILHIQTPHQLPKAYTLYVLGAIVICKELFYRILHRKGNQSESILVKADAFHHRSDAITSFMAFVGISIALYFGDGYESADDWAALLASGIILYNAYLIFKPALSEIMDENVFEELIEEIRLVAISVDGAVGTEKCFVRKSGLSYLVDLHLIVDGTLTVQRGHEIAHKVKSEIVNHFPQIEHVFIHVEPNE